MFSRKKGEAFIFLNIITKKNNLIDNKYTNAIKNYSATKNVCVLS